MPHYEGTIKCLATTYTTESNDTYLSLSSSPPIISAVVYSSGYIATYTEGDDKFVISAQKYLVNGSTGWYAI